MFERNEKEERNMKVKELFEGKQEAFGVKTVTDDGARYAYFKTKSEQESYIERMKRKLGSKLKKIVPFEVGMAARLGVVKEEKDSK